MYVYGGGCKKLTIGEKIITKIGMIMYEQNSDTETPPGLVSTIVFTNL